MVVVCGSHIGTRGGTGIVGCLISNLVPLIPGVASTVATISDLTKFRFSEFLLDSDPNQRYIYWVPSPYEGRFAIVISAGRDAVDVEVP